MWETKAVDYDIAPTCDVGIDGTRIPKRRV